VLLSASTGIGKTNAAIALGMRVSHGVGFLHWQQRRPARVLYVDGEMSRRLLKERLACEEGRLGSRPPGFLALSREDLENFQPLNTPKGQAWLLALIKKIGKLDLIIFDNVMSLLIGSMIEEESWAQAMPLVRILTQRNIGQLWVHHTGHDETRAYGTKTREWQLDTVIHLDAVEKDETDVSFMLSFKKARERTPATRYDFDDVHISLINDEWQHEASERVSVRPASPTALKFLDALTNVLTSDQAMPISGNRKAAKRDHWLKECAHLGLVDIDSKAHSARTLLSKYRRELVTANRVACGGDLTWRL
jgi:AAA domain